MFAVGPTQSVTEILGLSAQLAVGQFLPFWIRTRISPHHFVALSSLWVCHCHFRALSSLWASRIHFGTGHKLICLSGAGHAVSLCHFGVDRRLSVAQRCREGAVLALQTESSACSPLPQFPSAFFEAVSHSSYCPHHPTALSSDQDLGAGTFFSVMLILT